MNNNDNLNEAKLEKHINKLRKRELQILTKYLKSPWKMVIINFLGGTAKGVGFFLGAAVVITLLTVILTKFLGEVPVIGDFFDSLGEWIKQNRPISEL